MTSLILLNKFKKDRLYDISRFIKLSKLQTSHFSDMTTSHGL